MTCVGLRIYNNFDWRVVLLKLETLGYYWVSGDKPTELQMLTPAGVIFINPVDKLITFSYNVSATSESCSCYIVVR